ncbi:MAG TPA: hypothetical protein ENJ10_12950 [Caldithrix abyssi]|uniref:Transporter n=1 Tax=Caldithrix abyssi TaxID=187145 RepID=A0A7V1PVM8_CALAY|nr:hypothetical protein [Caldithrix abyssi]
MMKTFLLLATIMISLPRAQTCCSAGTPILSAIDGQASSAGNLRLALNYDFNRILDVYNGNRAITALRQRQTQAVLLNISYGFSDRWGVDILVSYIRHQRQLNTANINGSLDELVTAGLGDALLMLKYNVLVPDVIGQRQLTLGAGVKVPLGTADLKNSGILLPADMQPGTGSWDFAGWMLFSQGLLPAWPLTLTLRSSLRLNGGNNRFGVAGDSRFSSYRFGGVYTLSAAMHYRYEETILSLQGRFRYSGRDRFAGQAVSNTGGRWFYLTGGLTVNRWAPFSGQLLFTLPLWRNVNEVQLTTSYRLTTVVSWYFQ